MARSATDSENETEQLTATTLVNKTAASQPAEEPEADTQADDNDSEASEEYEIEAIIEAKRGYFPDHRIGYLVKWKGYDQTHNSWVDENDAGNAQGLIDEYWRTATKKDKKGGRKSVEGKPAKTPSISAKSGRKSTSAREESVASASASTKHKKRSGVDSDVEMLGSDKDEEEVRVKKKPKKSNGTASNVKPRNKSLAALDKDDDDEVEIKAEDDLKLANMKDRLHMASWENIVRTVDTVERRDDGVLLVYFTLTTKERVREAASLCAQKFPQKLIKFYESHLRWKDASPID